ncbi:MAG: hypothetical protein VYC39_08000 [Myxococcota bacterium]|nr:hypothetical protein [Myxococcota bacterium]
MSTPKSKIKPSITNSKRAVSKKRTTQSNSSKKTSRKATPQKDEYLARTLRIFENAKKSTLRLSKKTSKQLTEVFEDMTSDLRARFDEQVESSWEKPELKRARRFLDDQQNQLLGQYDKLLSSLGLMRISTNQ